MTVRAVTLGKIAQ